MGERQGYLAHFRHGEISRASARGPSYGAHSNLCVNQIRRNATTEHKRAIFPGYIGGRRRDRNERSRSGSEVVSSGSWQREGRPVRLTARRWIPTDGRASVVVYAKTIRRRASRHHGLVIERVSRIFHLAKLEKLGLRGSNTCDSYRRLRRPGHVLGGEGGGVEVLMAFSITARCACRSLSHHRVLDVVLPISPRKHSIAHGTSN